MGNCWTEWWIRLKKPDEESGITRLTAEELFLDRKSYLLFRCPLQRKLRSYSSVSGIRLLKLMSLACSVELDP